MKQKHASKKLLFLAWILMPSLFSHQNQRLIHEKLPHDYRIPTQVTAYLGQTTKRDPCPDCIATNAGSGTKKALGRRLRQAGVAGY